MDFYCNSFVTLLRIVTNSFIFVKLKNYPFSLLVREAFCPIGLLIARILFPELNSSFLFNLVLLYTDVLVVLSIAKSSFCYGS